MTVDVHPLVGHVVEEQWNEFTVASFSGPLLVLRVILRAPTNRYFHLTALMANGRVGHFSPGVEDVRYMVDMIHSRHSVDPGNDNWSVVC